METTLRISRSSNRDVSEPRIERRSRRAVAPGTRVGALSWAASIAVAMVACRGAAPASIPKPDRVVRMRVANLHAFARLYGVVRWFHPSDAAAAADWDRLAVEGVRRILDVPDVQSRRAMLAELFAPIAPTVHLAGRGEAYPTDPALHPASTAGLELVAWEHKGFGDSTFISEYVSKRRHRDHLVPLPGDPFVALRQTIDATPFRGARIRMRGLARATHHGRAQLWLRVDREEGPGFYDDMQERPVLGARWEHAEIVAPVAVNATRIHFGVRMGNNGTVWYDDIELAVEVPDGSWKPVEVRDAGFEDADLSASWSPGMDRGRPASVDNWKVVLDTTNPGSGSNSLRIERATRSSSNELFNDSPEPGETVDLELGDGLRARVPLVLYSKDGHTIGDRGPAQDSDGEAAVGSADFDMTVGLADVIVVWNVLQHFWPYFEVVPVDWNAELDRALADASDDRTMGDHLATLQRLSAAAPDAHARTSCLGQRAPQGAPFAVEVVEDRIVVTATAVPELQRGDVITSIDHQAAMAHLHADEALISGSPQWRRHRASLLFGGGPADSRVTVGVLRSGQPLEVSVTRNIAAREPFSHPPIDKLEDGVYYIDLSRATNAEVAGILESVAAAPGVVFDIRRQSNPHTALLSYLLRRTDDSKWLAMPHVLRPDHTARSISSWDISGWELPVRAPHIAGRVAFVTGPAAVSYMESLLGFVEHYHLGATLGSSTAGTNGNIAEIAEPSGCTTRFSGLRVTKHDGSRLHLVGFQPTIPAARTIAGVIAGRDEVLERALAYVRSGT